jgi:hypothetical protein
MTTIRSESAHDINGVPGRRFSVVTWPHGWQIANQKWTSEKRRIDGYGSKNATLQVELSFDDECKNGHSSFAITAEVRIPGRRDAEACGCLHSEISEVFPELAPLIKWHLVSTGGPMHYLANTIYHADEHGPKSAWVYFTAPAADPLGLDASAGKERLLGYVDTVKAAAADGQPGYRVEWDEETAKVRNLDHARSAACWPEATDAQLCVPRAELEVALRARLPALMAEFRAAMDACGFIWEAVPA